MIKDYKLSCSGHHHNIGNACSYEIHDGRTSNAETKYLTMENSLPSKKFSVKHIIEFIANLKTQSLHINYMFHRRRVKRLSYKTLTIILVTLSLVYLQLSSGIFQRYFLERDFGTEFRYSQDIDNFQDVIEHYLEYTGDPVDFQPSPQNTNYSKVAFLRSAEGISTTESIGLLIIVKSATRNYKKRMSIRKTWGNSQYLANNALATELPTKVAFICGTALEDDNAGYLLIGERLYGDIILAKFHDAYENNTYKTVLSMRWAVEHVKSFKYLMIVDDDMYVNLANAMAFLKKIPTTSVQAVTSGDSGVTAFYPVNQLKEVCTANANISLADKPLIMGQLIVDAKPFRSSFGLGSKWSMSMEDYPYNYFPPYIAGGVTLFDRKTVSRLYYGSFFTKHFWVDDVYIGIIAYKLGIILTNNNLMDSSYKLYYKQKLQTNFHDMIAVHGLQCPEQLIDLWHSNDLEALKDCYYLNGSS